MTNTSSAKILLIWLKTKFFRFRRIILFQTSSSSSSSPNGLKFSNLKKNLRILKLKKGLKVSLRGQTFSTLVKLQRRLDGEHLEEKSLTAQTVQVVCYSMEEGQKKRSLKNQRKRRKRRKNILRKWQKNQELIF